MKHLARQQAPHTILLGTAIFFTIIVLIFSFLINSEIRSGQQFSHLAQSFLHGRLDFLVTVDDHHDNVFLHDKYYWPLGPFPSIVVLPFVFIFSFLGSFFYQAYLHIPIIIGTFYLVYSISKRIEFSSRDSFFWAFAFCFGSVYMGVVLISQSWYFAHAIVVLLLFLALYEYLGKKRFWYIGIVLALATATRMTAGLSGLFFFIMIMRSKGEVLKTVVQFIVPFLCVGLLLSIYNQLRFGSIFEQGYSQQILITSLEKARSYGIFNLVHVPTNLYYFLIKTPDPVFKDTASHVLKFPYIAADQWGMSIFFTSPYFVWLLKAKKWDRVSMYMFLTVVGIALPIFFYYGVGVSQYGYRYSMDFLPLLFFTLLYLYRKENKKLSLSMKSIFVCTGIVNFYLLLIFMQVF